MWKYNFNMFFCVMKSFVYCRVIFGHFFLLSLTIDIHYRFLSLLILPGFKLIYFICQVHWKMTLKMTERRSFFIVSSLLSSNVIGKSSLFSRLLLMQYISLPGSWWKRFLLEKTNCILLSANISVWFERFPSVISF